MPTGSVYSVRLSPFLDNHPLHSVAPTTPQATGRQALSDGTWQLRAACRGLNPAAFYPGRGIEIDVDDVCPRDCPVRLECLNAAMSEDEGIWGRWREDTRLTVRRLARQCPQCFTPIARHTRQLFCSDECVETAASSVNGERARINGTLDAWEAMAAHRTRLRKQGVRSAELPSLPAPLTMAPDLLPLPVPQAPPAPIQMTLI